jgi:hypothetical protein
MKNLLIKKAVLEIFEEKVNMRYSDFLNMNIYEVKDEVEVDEDILEFVNKNSEELVFANKILIFDEYAILDEDYDLSAKDILISIVENDRIIFIIFNGKNLLKEVVITKEELLHIE